MSNLHIIRTTTRHLLNWEVARNFGSLQILTKASYTMILLVPVLAGIWVPFISNEYQAAQHIMALCESTTPSVDTFVSNSSAACSTQEKTYFPFSLVLSFWAALLVLFGHLIYQAAAPQDIKTYLLHDYIQREIDEYFTIKNNSEQTAKDMQSNTAAIILEIHERRNIVTDKQDLIDNIELNDDVKNVMLRAKAQYLDSALDSRWKAILSNILYFLGFLLILCIMGIQCEKVLSVTDKDNFICRTFESWCSASTDVVSSTQLTQQE